VIVAVFCLTAVPILYKSDAVPISITDEFDRSEHLPQRLSLWGNVNIRTTTSTLSTSTVVISLMEQENQL